MHRVQAVAALDGRCDLPSSAQDAPARQRLPALDRLVEWLCASAVWPRDGQPVHAEWSRVWAGRHQRITFELRLHFAASPDKAVGLIQGGVGKAPKRMVPRNVAGACAGWVTGVALADDSRGFWVSTPDADSQLSLDDRCIPFAAGKGRLRILAFRVGRRCVLHGPLDCGHGPTEAFIKCYRRLPWLYAHRQYNRLREQLSRATDGFVRTPRVAVCDGDRRTVVFEPIDAAGPQVSPDETERLSAHALSALHSLALTAPKVHTIIDELRTVGRWHGLISSMMPALAPQFRALAGALARLSLRVSAADRVLVHKDFHPGQFIAAAREFFLTDLDTLALGHPEVDIATFAAHRALAAMSAGEGTTAPLMPRCEAFADEYCQAGGIVDRRRLRFYLGCALARLGAIHAFRKLSATQVRQLWELAGALAHQ